jgi:hypothetical protein
MTIPKMMKKLQQWTVYVNIMKAWMNMVKAEDKSVTKETIYNHLEQK